MNNAETAKMLAEHLTELNITIMKEVLKEKTRQYIEAVLDAIEKKEKKNES